MMFLGADEQYQSVRCIGIYNLDDFIPSFRIQKHLGPKLEAEAEAEVQFYIIQIIQGVWHNGMITRIHLFTDWMGQMTLSR